ncbi:hypothetical protein Tco_0788172 [Tanacetum coccineum]
MLKRAMAKQLSAASAHECLFVDFLSEEEPKKASKALKHPGWVDAMQDELNQFTKNKTDSSSTLNPLQLKSLPKNNLFTLEKTESPNPFLLADQVEFIFKEIAFTTNNEVALLYPSHPNSDYFREVSYFISKCCLKEAFVNAPTQYKEYLSEFWYTTKTLDDSKIWVSTPTGGIRGNIGINTFRNALRAHYLSHSSMYVSPPSITIVRAWFATIGYSGEIGAKETLKKSCLHSCARRLVSLTSSCDMDVVIFDFRIGLVLIILTYICDHRDYLHEKVEFQRISLTGFRSCT